jgi:hypothetical protein
MSQHSPSDGSERIDSVEGLPRRQVLAAGAGIGVSLLAGCSSGGDTGEPTDGQTTAGETTTTADRQSESVGSFELLISDRPADIGDFDRLSVTVDSARVFPKSVEPTTEPATTTNTTATAAATTAEPATGTTTQADAPEDAGFTVLDLENPTVDLTTVLGEDAVSVFEGDLAAGTYTKVELHVAEVEGIVDGESVPVKVPSEKLQIVHNFTVGDQPVQFVFDINVVKKGPNGYNLLPVISESGVAGKDVPVNVIDPEAATTGTEQSTTQSGQPTATQRPTTETFAE